MRVAKWQVAVLVLVAVALLGAVAAVNAQSTGGREACRQAKYDINSDGVFNWSDLNAWKAWYWANGCALGREIAGSADPCGRLDLDNNGILERADLDMALNLYYFCYKPVVRPSDR